MVELYLVGIDAQSIIKLFTWSKQLFIPSIVVLYIIF